MKVLTGRYRSVVMAYCRTLGNRVVILFGTNKSQDKTNKFEFTDDTSAL